MFSYTRTEEFVYRLLKSLGVASPQQLSIKSISELLNIRIEYWDHSSETTSFKGKFIIFLKQRDNKREQWQEFTHELCHLFWHVGRQETLPKSFVQLQEHQANLFAYHFSVPTFMLEKESDLSVYKIMNIFNVEHDFALRRLEMYKAKFYVREGIM